MAERDINKDRKNLLFEKTRIELVCQKDSSPKPAAFHSFLEMLREDGASNFSHLSLLSMLLRRFAASPESRENATAQQFCRDAVANPAHRENAHAAYPDASRSTARLPVHP